MLRCSCQVAAADSCCEGTQQPYVQSSQKGWLWLQHIVVWRMYGRMVFRNLLAVVGEQEECGRQGGNKGGQLVRFVDAQLGEPRVPQRTDGGMLYLPNGRSEWLHRQLGTVSVLVRVRQRCAGRETCVTTTTQLVGSVPQDRAMSE